MATAAALIWSAPAMPSRRARFPARRGGEGHVLGQRTGRRELAVKCLQGRGVMIDLFAHYGRKRHAVGYDDLMRVMAADGIEVEAGDFVLLRTGFDEVILEARGTATPTR